MAPATPLDDVSFLARSPHRVEVLRRLQDGDWTRPDLHDATGISQPTLGRVLGAFEDRNWVERNGQAYTLTPFGDLVASEFTDLLDTVETVQRLDDVAGLFPTAALGFDVERLASATITTPTTGDVFRHVQRFQKQILEAEHVRIATDTMAPDPLEKLRNRVVAHAEGDLLVETILTGTALDQALSVPTIVDLVRDLVESAHAPVYRYDGSIPMGIGVADGVAMLAPADDHGIPGALVETDDEVVRAWVVERLDDYRGESTRLTVDDLPG